MYNSIDICTSTVFNNDSWCATRLSSHIHLWKRPCTAFQLEFSDAIQLKAAERQTTTTNPFSAANWAKQRIWSRRKTIQSWRRFGSRLTTNRPIDWRFEKRLGERWIFNPCHRLGVWDNDEDSIWVLVEASFSDKPMFTCVETRSGGVNHGKIGKRLGTIILKYGWH